MNHRRPFVGIIIILLVAVCAFGEQADNAGLVRFGLFVGSNDGGTDRVRLAYAAQDARAISEVMTEMGGIQPGSSLMLEDPSRKELEDGFAVLRNLIAGAKTGARRVEFMLYYSGHSDDQGLLLGGEHYGYVELRGNITGMDSDVNIAILDSCSSGAFTRLKGGTRQSPFLFDESVNTKGHAFLTSSSEDEAAQESDSIGGSFFTHYLVSALRGAADSTRDGMVTLNEAYTYAFSETLSRTATTLAGPQHASHEISLTGSGELILTDLRVSNAGIILHEDLRGRLFIKDRDGRMVAEVRKDAGTPLALALPVGSYTLTIDDGESLNVASVSVTSSSKVDIRPGAFSPMKAEVTTSRGGAFTGKDSQEAETVTSVAELTGEIVDDLVHIGRMLTFIPDMVARERERLVIDELSLKLVGSAYRINGFDIGLLNMVREDLRGTQIAGVGNVVGEDVDGIQLGGVFSIVDNGVRGGQASGVFNLADGTVYGAQTSGVFNITGGDLYGGQAAGVFNLAGGSARWFQGAGVFNVVEGDQAGFQGAGVFNVLGGDAYGFQGAGVFNVTGGNVYGFQGGGVFNVAGASVSGFQGSGVVNVAGGSMNGVQATGVLNVADSVNGGQLGLINVGGKVNGVQAGLVNVSGRMNGLAFGLINVSGNGLYDPSFWSDNNGYTYAGFQLGAGAFYTLVYGGGPYKHPESALTLGLGWGIHSEFGQFFIDADASVKSLGSGVDLGMAIQDSALDFLDIPAYAQSTDGMTIGLYPMVRGTLGLTLFGRAALIGGISLEGHLPGVTEKTEYFHSGSPWVLSNSDIPGRALEVYPRWYLGIRI
ncbi:MAG: caspase family protein [Spirochaetales bacterium]|nr:caspase family protein [Spirochaetales bacterium]